MHGYRKAVGTSFLAGSIVGLASGAFMMWLAWKHNPQEAIHGGEYGTAWAYWLGIGCSWFVVVGAVSSTALSAASAAGIAAWRMTGERA